jgi:hypothetical protein
MTNLLKEGDIIELKEGHKINADVLESDVFFNNNSDKLTHFHITILGKYSSFAGKYLVYKTAYDGGGKGFGLNDDYPNGHHVYCEKLDNPEIKVDFYQTGCFHSIIRDIECQRILS